MAKCITRALLLLLLLVSCGGNESGRYSISGNAGKEGEKVFLFGLDSRYERLDSTTSNSNGDFIFTLPADTVMPLALIMPDGRSVTLYAEPGVKATLQEDVAMRNGYCVNGGATQALHDSISRLLDACKSNSERMARIDSFIARYPVNEVCIEIIRRYMVEVPAPDNNHIRNRISKLGGILQDHEFFVTTKNSIEKKNSNTLHRLFPHFSYTTSEGESVTLSTYKEKYTLITIWAPWDKPSIEGVRKLRVVADSVKSKSFAMLNVALDCDTARWRETIAGDSIVGDNVCDTKEWNSELAANFNIKSLPYSILLSPYQRIIMFGADLDKAGGHIDSLATNFDEEQERRKLKNKTKKNR